MTNSPTNLENAERAEMTMTPHAYAQEYEFRGNTDYTPSDFERTMIEDAILGYLGEARIAERAEMEPKVKALEWEDDCGELFAKALFSDHYGISSFSKKEHLLTFPDEVRRGETFKSIEAAKAAAQQDFASRIRSCLLDKPEAGEVPTGVLNDMLLARAPDCRWTIASILKERGLNYRQRLDYMRAALSAALTQEPTNE